MGRLKKLLLFKRFFVKMPKQTFLQVQPRPVYQVGVNDSSVSFWTNKTNAQKLASRQDEQIEISDQLKRVGKWLFFKHSIGVITVILICLLFIASNLFIREIVFANEQYANPEVYQYVRRNLKQLGPVYVLPTSVSELSQSLRETYSYYAWIGISRNGGKLIIDIEMQDVPQVEEEDLSQKGNLVAIKDGIIKSYFVKRGVVIIFKDQAVKANQILVTGNTRFHNNENSLDDYVRSSGIVIAQTLTSQTLEVPKTSEQEEYTGKVESSVSFSLFNKRLFAPKSPYENSYQKTQPIFQIGKFMSLDQVYFYQKELVKNVFDEDDAIKYAKSQVMLAFETKRTHPNEQINYINVLGIKETATTYQIKLLIQADENIARFVKVA